MLPVDEPRGVEDAVAAMHHVVVERNHHQRRVGDDAAELAGVERGEGHRLAFAQRAEAGQHVGGGQHLQVGVGSGHGGHSSTRLPGGLDAKPWQNTANGQVPRPDIGGGGRSRRGGRPALTGQPFSSRLDGLNETWSQYQS